MLTPGDNTLKAKIRELGEKTGLFADCTPNPDGEWQYSYKILQNIEDIPLKIGLETVTYKGSIVVAHAFLHSPVE